MAEPERLYALSRQGSDPDGNSAASTSCEYPLFQLMRAAVKEQAELIAVSYADRHGSDLRVGQEMEKAYLQYVSGWMFGRSACGPRSGRLLTENDDLTPGAHPYAVLSYDYWTRRFGADPQVIGRTFRMGETLYEIVGVCPAPSPAPRPGTVIDIFVPTMMHPGVDRDPTELVPHARAAEAGRRPRTLRAGCTRRLGPSRRSGRRDSPA